MTALTALIALTVLTVLPVRAAVGLRLGQAVWVTALAETKACVLAVGVGSGIAVATGGRGVPAAMVGRGAAGPRLGLFLGMHESPESMGLDGPAGSADAAVTAGVARSADAACAGTRMAETPQPAETAECVDLVDHVDPVDPVDPVDSVDSVDPADPLDPVDLARSPLRARGPFDLTQRPPATAATRTLSWSPSLVNHSFPSRYSPPRCFAPKDGSPRKHS
ncbi:unnamed protein product [Closterium sp. NIES-54]